MERTIREWGGHREVGVAVVGAAAADAGAGAVGGVIAPAAATTGGRNRGEEIRNREDSTSEQDPTATTQIRIFP